MIRAFVDLTKRTLMSTTFDPRRPHCYVKCLGSFETHFTHNAFKSLLLPLVAFLLDCLSKECPNASALKDWRTMRRTYFSFEERSLEYQTLETQAQSVIYSF